MININYLADSTNASVTGTTIPADETEVIIQNTDVTQDTYIYITPTSNTNTNTNNQIIYVKSKELNQFTVAIPQATNQDITFNYWIIQTLPQ